MADAALPAVAGTAVLWVISGVAAVLIGVALAAGSLSRHRSVWSLSRTAVNVTRGVPTSILVIAGGILALRFVPAMDLPAVFPGTHPGFQHVAWALAVALALGSGGHLAEIFRSGYLTLGQTRRDALTVLGLSRRRRLALTVTESALVALPATGTRLVHHLHNTAFAALFPVSELFGLVLSQASASFRVVDVALAGTAVYIVLSLVVWSCCKAVEGLLRHGVSGVRSVRKAVVA